MNPETRIETCRGCLEKILSSTEFSNAPRSSLLLRYLVEQTLKGNQDHLKGYTIGVDVFDRPDTFDPSSDPIVRVQMRRLRGQLDGYYRAEGATDPIRIVIPLGTCMPSFQENGPRERSGHAKASRFPAAFLAGAPFSVAAIATLVLMVLLVVSWNFAANTVSQPSAGPLEMGRSWPKVLVTAFETAEAEPELVAVRDELFEHVVSDLVKFSTLRVSARKQAPTRHPAQNTRAERSAQYLVTGRINRLDNKLHVHVSFERAVTKEVIWATSYAYEISRSSEPDHRALIEISRSIANAVGAPFGPVIRKLTGRVTAVRPDAPTVYSCTHWFYAYIAGQTEERHRKAFECIRKVPDNERESSWWAVNAIILLDQYRRGFATADVSQAQHAALEAARKSVTLDRDNALAQLALAHAAIANGLLVEGKRAIAQAVASNPADDFVLAGASWVYSVLGDWEKGRALSQKSIDLNPFFPHHYHAISAIYHYRNNDQERAIEIAALFFRNDCLLSHAIYAAVLGRDDRMRGRQVARMMTEKFPGYAEGLRRAVTTRRLPGDLLSSLQKDLARLGVQL